MQASTPLFYNFNAPTHFSNHIFSKLCFLPRRGAQFCKTTSSNCNQQFHFFDPQTASKRACVIILFAHIALFAVPIAIFSLLDPIKILILAHDLCIFSLPSPVSKNDRMHHTYIFINFVPIIVNLHRKSDLQGDMLIFVMLEIIF